MSASCSIEPDSRRSESCGRLSSRCSTARRELRQADHRHVQFLGQLLETAADLGDFLDPILVGILAGALEQLEIVDDDHPDALLPLEAAGARPQRGDGQAGRVVDVERQALELGGGARQLAEVLLADLAHAQIFRADPRLLGEDARGELVGRHFEAEQGDRRAGRLVRLEPVLLVAQEALGGGEADVGAERALAHARAAGDDDQVRLDACRRSCC